MTWVFSWLRGLALPFLLVMTSSPTLPSWCQGGWSYDSLPFRRSHHPGPEAPAQAHDPDLPAGQGATWLPIGCLSVSRPGLGLAEGGSCGATGFTLFLAPCGPGEISARPLTKALLLLALLTLYALLSGSLAPSLGGPAGGQGAEGAGAPGGGAKLWQAAGQGAQTWRAGGWGRVC